MLHILLVDDDPNDRLLIIRELEREFTELQVTPSVDAEALATALVGDRFVSRHYRPPPALEQRPRHPARNQVLLSCLPRGHVHQYG